MTKLRIKTLYDDGSKYAEGWAYYVYRDRDGALIHFRRELRSRAVAEKAARDWVAAWAAPRPPRPPDPTEETFYLDV